VPHFKVKAEISLAHVYIFQMIASVIEQKLNVGQTRQMYEQGIKRKNLTIVDVTDEKQRY
jgi:hypothetical protein